MKTIAIILGVLCAGLAFGLYKKGDSAGREAEASLKLHESLSNQVAELRTKLALEQGTAGQSQSNAQFVINKRTAELTYASNRIVQANLMLKSAQGDAQAAQQELQSKAAQIAVLETQRDDLKQRLEALPLVQKQLAEAKEKLAAAGGGREALTQELQQLRLEKADLLNKLADVEFLRTQLARTEQDEEVRLRAIRAGSHAPVPKQARLELQPDGTVRPVIGRQ